MNNNQILDVLTREGVLINVSVHYWRATKKLQAEDLGLDPENVTNRLISLGHKKLLPKDALKDFSLIEGRVHALVLENTFPFLNGLSHFLPNTKLEEVSNRLQEFQREFENSKNNFTSRYSLLREQARAEWNKVASRLVKNPDALVSSILGAFPDVFKMQRSFRFDVCMFQIRLPDELDSRIINLKEHEAILNARKQAANSASIQIQRDVNQFVSDCVVSLRDQTSKLCEEMLESINTCKSGVHQKTLNRLIRLVDQFKQLNFVGDREMEEQLRRVRKEFLQRTAEDYRNNDVARVGLKQGLQNLRNIAKEMAQQDTQELVERFGALGQRKFKIA